MTRALRRKVYKVVRNKGDETELKEWKKIKKELKKSKKEKRKVRDRKNPRSYKTYIESSLWAERKNAYYRKHKKECAKCKSTTMVQLHHMKYIKVLFGNEPNDHLIPLCINCHKDFHTQYGVKSDMIKDTKLFLLQ